MSQVDPMLDIFVFECQQLLEKLEDVLLEGEKAHQLNEEQVNEVFRTMHTIKGSSSMMGFDNLAHVAHAVEDLFANIREKKARSGDWDKIFDMVLGATDIIKADVGAIAAGGQPGKEGDKIIEQVRNHLELLSHRVAKPAAEEREDDGPEDGEPFEEADLPFYKIKALFEPGCHMESLRAFGLVNELAPKCVKLAHIPPDISDDSSSADIAKNGFLVFVQSPENPDSLKALVDSTMFLQSSTILLLADDNEELPDSIRTKKQAAAEAATAKKPVSFDMAKQNFISINVNKLDKLLDLGGEIVTTESMVTKNPEVTRMQIESFERSGQQLRKLINEMQDTVMSIRMVPISTAFHKMQRIVRDMSKKIGKDVQLNIIGEETEVDKNVIDTLGDPLMHLVRNAVDHGLELPSVRTSKGKSATGQLTLEARNTGGDVTILVQDDGKGLNREQLIKKAIDRGLTTKAESDITDKEAYGFVFAPGFSTKEQVTEFSGRGVGMDVVRRNIEKIGGSITVDSTIDQGTTIQIRIPLTLAIIEGMKLRVGDLIFIVPMLTLRESFKPVTEDILLDPDGSEMIMIRGECFPIVRLHRLFDIPCQHERAEDGILIMIESEQHTFCLLVDELIGEQQTVIKPLPLYIQRHNLGMHGIGGCAILGDGSISLIIDINTLLPAGG